MEDKKTLGSYKTLRHGSNIMLVMRLPGGSTREFELFVKVEMHRVINLRVKSTNTIKSIKSMIQKMMKIPPNQQMLFLGKEQLRDECTLRDYNILKEMGLDLQLKWKVDRSLPKTKDYCMIAAMNSEEDGVEVLKMPCGHSMSSEGLMQYAKNEVSAERKTEIKCPQCPKIWSLATIRRYSGATASELDELEESLSRNFCIKSDDINQCPKCQSFITRQNPKENSVKCIICSKKSSDAFYFCWYCLRDWKSPSLSATSCGNPGCNDAEKLAQLRDCGTVKVAYTSTTVPQFRACPHCGTVIELAGGCKQMKCKSCQKEFCFICLKKRSWGSWGCGQYDTKCQVAPVQTSIPHK